MSPVLLGMAVCATAGVWLWSREANAVASASALLGNSPLKKSPRVSRRALIVTALTTMLLSMVSLCAFFRQPLLVPIFGATLGIALLSRAFLKRRRATAAKRAVDFYLPVVIERLVMAVEAGLDVLPAIDAIVRLESESGYASDPVTKLFERVRDQVDKGETLEAALESSAAQLDSVSARHALVHLAIAHREGGELMIPLRELSDATQLNFQEQVEEEIAKLPVRATLPLLCTFAGLLLIFLTLPMIQIVTIAARSAPQQAYE